MVCRLEACGAAMRLFNKKPLRTQSGLSAQRPFVPLQYYGRGIAVLLFKSASFNSARFAQLIENRRILERRYVLRNLLALRQRAQQTPHDLARARLRQVVDG